MKKMIFSSACILILFAHSVYSQDWSTNVYRYGEKYPGYIVKLSGDTIQGYIEFNDRVTNQEKVLFFTDPKDRKTKVVYKPSDLKAYMVADKTYRSIHYTGGLLGKPLGFNLLLKEGRIGQYIWYNHSENYLTIRKGLNESQEDFDKRYYTTEKVFVKGDEKPFDMSAIGLKFAKFWAEKTADYPELSTKIANKEKGYGLIRMYEFIEEYNTWWANNHK